MLALACGTRLSRPASDIRKWLKQGIGPHHAGAVAISLGAPTRNPLVSARYSAVSGRPAILSR